MALTPFQIGARVYIPSLGRFTSQDPVQGGNDNTYGYPGDPVNGGDLDGRCGPVCVYIAVLLLRAAPYLVEGGNIAVESVGGVGAGRSVAPYVSVEQKAANVSQILGKNSVQVKTADSIIHYDVAGKAHINKLPGGEIQRVNTPHVQIRQYNNGYAGNKGLARPMNHADIRIIKKIISKRR